MDTCLASLGHSTYDAAAEMEANCPMLLRLAAQLHAIKVLPRTGWKARGLPEVESVAAHSHGVVVWALWLIDWTEYRTQSEGSISTEKVLAMAALHDLPEASTGDLMPSQKEALLGPDKELQKRFMHQAEERFWKRLRQTDSTTECSVVQEVSKRSWGRWTRLWEEYRAATSLEAQIVKQADAFDCLLQAIVYRMLFHVPLDVFQRLLQQASRGDALLSQYLSLLWEQSKPSTSLNG